MVPYRINPGDAGDGVRAAQAAQARPHRTGQVSTPPPPPPPFPFIPFCPPAPRYPLFYKRGARGGGRQRADPIRAPPGPDTGLETQDLTGPEAQGRSMKHVPRSRKFQQTLEPWCSISYPAVRGQAGQAVKIME